jgi:S-DNA-T family DNA segregation ATPase FtsK/SpoIIIE
MQIVVDAGSEPCEVDVRINDPAATVSDLAAALRSTLPVPATAEPLIDGQPAGPRVELVDSGLCAGAEVVLAEGGTGPPAAPVELWLEVVGGLDAGRRLPLPAGRAVLGRDPECDLVLASDTVSRRHAEFAVDDQCGVRVRDLESLNGTWVDGVALTATAESLVPIGSSVRFGALQVAVRPTRMKDRPTAVDAGPGMNAAGTIGFNRPPRAAPRPPVEPIEVPVAPPPTSTTAAFNTAAFVAPLVLAGALFAATRQIGFLAFTMLSPVMVFGSWLQGKVRGRRGSRRDRQRFAVDLERFRAALFDAVTEHVEGLEQDHPDPAELLRRAQLPSVRLWERRPEHHDFLKLRAAVGELPWTPPVGEVDRQAPIELRRAIEAVAVLPAAPVAVDLSGGGVIGVVGHRSAVLAVARSLLGQASVLHGPADLPVAVFAEARHASAWDWAKWLPHVRDRDGGQRRLSADTELSTRMIEAWLAAANDPAGPGATSTATAADRGLRAQRAPTLLVVVDDQPLTEGRQAPLRSLLRGGAGPVAGIVVAASADRLPALCSAVIELHDADGAASLHVPRAGVRIDGLLATGMAEDTARRCGRALARFDDPELATTGAGLPELVRLLPLVEPDGIDAEVVLARWSRAGPDPPLRTPIGITGTVPLVIDLARDGPHALVGGTTGSGKSELLRTLVAGLAVNAGPDHLTFVLIDFKGGSAFDECARLPHTVGLVTDLDEHLAERALRCLEAELTHRERGLRAAGVGDLPAYRRLGAGPPLPRLVVVIDEFATLRAELPDFVDALVGMAQRGRSLGVHLVLATQRPTGSVSDNIKANTNLRIALRVQDAGDSNDIIGRPDAARLPRHVAGRAQVRLGAGEVIAIQTALVTAEHGSGGIAPVEVAPFVFGPSPRADPGCGQSPPPPPGVRPVTDLGLLVDAIAEAHRRSGRPEPRRPWPDPLPPRVDLERLLVDWPSASSERPDVLFALADQPECQTQFAVGWRPASGNLLVYGVLGAGTTTALATVALSLAWAYPADRAQLYVLEFGAGGLADLGRLPHTGAVIGASERERQIRLVRHLRAELDRRRDLTPSRLRQGPMLVLLLDGFAAFNAEYRDLVGVSVMDDFQRVFADGPDVGIHVVASADRVGAVPSSMASLVRQRLLLRLADPFDYAQLGLASVARPLPRFTPGGGVLAEPRLVVQVATPAERLDEAATRFAGRHPPPERPPVPIGRLPVVVTLAELAGPGVMAELGRRPWRIPIGIGDADLGPAWLVAHQGEHALIAGPGRSGKTSALVGLASVAAAARPDLRLVVVAPKRSPLPGLVDAEVCPELDALAELAVDGRPTIVLVDDAETIDDEAGVFGRLLGEHHPGLLLAVAGRSDALRGSLGHWTRALRRSRLGVLLRPNLDLDGELLGTSLPRRVSVPWTAGRGFLVINGEPTIVQWLAPDVPRRHRLRSLKQHK